MPASVARQPTNFLMEEERRDSARLFDPLMENVFESFFDFSKDEELKLFESGNLLPETFPGDSVANTTMNYCLEKKRKSLDWSSKPNRPVYKRNKLQSTKSTPPSSNHSTYLSTQTQAQTQPIDMFPVEPLPFINEYPSPNNTYQEDMAMLSDLFLNDLKAVKPVKKVLLKSRKSEDWGRKPVFETKKRAKWSNDELQQLWQGISRHGNNWTDITEEIESRSYCQIKDKGRRCLFLLGWSTGRSKVETDESNIHAKKIANQVLSQMYTNTNAPIRR